MRFSLVAYNFCFGYDKEKEKGKEFMGQQEKNTEHYNYTKIIEPLLEWYEKEKRELPWRSNKNPYYIWISEIMLQQTRVEAVKGYFYRFMKELPTIEALAYVSEEKLLKLWEGLGYYNRARNLKKAAVVVMEEYHGNLPEDYEALLRLPGIGSYTAGAIASIAYGIPVPAVDGNVLRVTKRLSAGYEDISKDKVKKEMERELQECMPTDRAGDFNQALMELGAMVCIPNGMPFCEKCPVASFCLAKQRNVVMDLPVKAKKKERITEEKTVLVLHYKNNYAIQKRGEKGLLAGLYELPNFEGIYKEDRVEEYLWEHGILIDRIEQIGNAKHIFTHKEWHMVGYFIEISSISEISKEAESFQGKLQWVSKEQMEESYALPSAFEVYKRKIN